MLKVQGAVREVFDTLSPRDDISMEKFSEMTLEVRKKVEGATEADRNSNNWLAYLLPPRHMEEFVLRESGVASGVASTNLGSGPLSGTAALRRLLDETSDLIESPPFTQVLTLLLDAGFSMLVDQKVAQQSFKVPPTPTSSNVNVPRVQDVTGIGSVKLPIVLATLTRQAHVIGNGVPNEYLQAMEQVRDLEAFAAVVYSSNWESEVTPMTEDRLREMDKQQQLGESGVQSKPSSNIAGQESIIDVGTASVFENAWGKAVDVVDQLGAKV